MPDLEKVIKALEICYTFGHNCTEFPLFSEDDCNDRLVRDAIAMLKAQEPVKPVLKRIRLGFHTDAVHIEPCCGGCGHKLETWYKYCSYCGRAVKWDEAQC